MKKNIILRGCQQSEPTADHDWHGPGGQDEAVRVEPAGRDSRRRQRRDDEESDDGEVRRLGRTRIAMEVGTHSPWVSRLLTALGHERWWPTRGRCG